jgi:hypothetical protein
VEVYCTINPAANAFNLLAVAAANVLRRPIYIASSIADMTSSVGCHGYSGVSSVSTVLPLLTVGCHGYSGVSRLQVKKVTPSLYIH